MCESDVGLQVNSIRYLLATWVNSKLQLLLDKNKNIETIMLS